MSPGNAEGTTYIPSGAGTPCNPSGGEARCDWRRVHVGYFAGRRTRISCRKWVDKLSVFVLWPLDQFRSKIKKTMLCSHGRYLTLSGTRGKRGLLCRHLAAESMFCADFKCEAALRQARTAVGWRIHRCLCSWPWYSLAAFPWQFFTK